MELSWKHPQTNPKINPKIIWTDNFIVSWLHRVAFPRGTAMSRRRLSKAAPGRRSWRAMESQRLPTDSGPRGTQLLDGPSKKSNFFEFLRILGENWYEFLPIWWIDMNCGSMVPVHRSHNIESYDMVYNMAITWVWLCKIHNTSTWLRWHSDADFEVAKPWRHWKTPRVSAKAGEMPRVATCQVLHQLNPPPRRTLPTMWMLNSSGSRADDDWLMDDPGTVVMFPYEIHIERCQSSFA